MNDKAAKRKARITKLFLEGGTDKDLLIVDSINDLEDKFDDTLKEIKDNTPDLKKVLETVTGKDGKDYVITKEDLKEIAFLAAPLVNKSLIKGEDGKDYTLTADDKKEIARSITVPVVEKIIERTEVIRERPLVTENIREVAMYEKPESLRDKLESLLDDERIDYKAIKGFEEFFKKLGNQIEARAISILDQRSSYLVQKVSNLQAQVNSLPTTGGTGYTKATPVGAVNSSNTSFTVTATPVYVVSDGVTYFDGAGYTAVGLTITMDIPPTQYIRYFY